MQLALSKKHRCSLNLKTKEPFFFPHSVENRFSMAELFVRVPKYLLDEVLSISKEFEAICCTLPQNVQVLVNQLGSKLQELQSKSNDRQSTVGS